MKMDRQRSGSAPCSGMDQEVDQMWISGLIRSRGRKEAYFLFDPLITGSILTSYEIIYKVG